MAKKPAPQASETTPRQAVPTPQQMAFFRYVNMHGFSDELRYEAQCECAKHKILIWDFFDWEVLNQWHEAEMWCQERQPRLDDDREQYLKDWRRCRSHLSLVMKRLLGPKGFKTERARDILGTMLRRFYEDIVNAYPLATGSNNPGKGLKAAAETLYRGIRLRKPTSFDCELDEAALRLHTLGHNPTTIARLLDYVLTRLAPPAFDRPKRYLDTLTRKVKKVLPRISSSPLRSR
jgi:hypothetical protein